MKRTEIKYIINNKQKLIILEILNKIAQIDSFCNNGVYSIKTIYLISWKTKDFKGKIRLRQYISGERNSYFIENKYKSTTHQYKTRVEISEKEFEKAINNIDAFSTYSKEIKKIFFFNKYNDVVASKIISNVFYSRMAYYIKSHNESIRITVDSHLNTEVGKKTVSILDENFSILEIKGKSIPQELIDLLNLDSSMLFLGSKYRLSKYVLFQMNGNDEIDIMENEIKISSPYEFSFVAALTYLKSKYSVLPYDCSVVYDTYYDTNDMFLYENECSFRLRRKRNASLNFKTKGYKYNNIWSRREYRDIIDIKKIESKHVLYLFNRINEIVKKYLDVTDLSVLKKKHIIVSKRISYLIKSKHVDETQKADIIGICTFDKFYSLDKPNKVYKEIEIETCNDLISPCVFCELINIQKDLCARYSFCVSTSSKYKRVVDDELTTCDN